MCDTYLKQLIVLAKHRVTAFAMPTKDKPNQYDVCFDTPHVYTRIPGYFDFSVRSPRRSVCEINLLTRAPPVVCV